MKQEIIKKKIEAFGFQQVEDRDMSENYGYLYKRVKDGKFVEGGHIQLQYWRIHPRIRTSVYGRTSFDTGVVTEDELIKILEDKEQEARDFREKLD